MLPVTSTVVSAVPAEVVTTARIAPEIRELIEELEGLQSERPGVGAPLAGGEHKRECVAGPPGGLDWRRRTHVVAVIHRERDPRLVLRIASNSASPSAWPARRTASG
jgi:hypothetical protein